MSKLNINYNKSKLSNNRSQGKSIGTFLTENPRKISFCLFSVLTLLGDPSKAERMSEELAEEDRKQTSTALSYYKEIDQEYEGYEEIDHANKLAITGQTIIKGGQLIDKLGDLGGTISGIPGRYSGPIGIGTATGKGVAIIGEVGGTILENVADEMDVKAHQKLLPLSISEAISQEIKNLNKEKEKNYKKYIIKANNRYIYKITDKLYLTSKHKRQQKNFVKYNLKRDVIDYKISKLVELKDGVKNIIDYEKDEVLIAKGPQKQKQLSNIILQLQYVKEELIKVRAQLKYIEAKEHIKPSLHTAEIKTNLRNKKNRLLKLFELH